MRFLYTFLFYLAIPFILARLIWRSKRLPAYRKRWKERFACFAGPKDKGGLWLHAVSFGETIAAIPLIKQFRLDHPNVPITVTNMTPTGSEKVRSTFGNEVFNVYLPYDLPILMRRFIYKVKPALVVIMETELWPNMLWQLKKHKVPVLLLNGRLSKRSAENYNKVKLLMRPIFACLTQLLVQTHTEADRYVSLGCDMNKILVTGSIKFDIAPPEGVNSKAAILRKTLGENRAILVAASTHAGEEAIILKAVKKAKENVHDLLLLLVPRHPDRFDEVAKLCIKEGLKVVRRTQQKSCEAETDVFLGDTMGEMFLFYAASDLAFVGGSLVPVGGHNVLEPAALGKAIITGPHMHNFLEITKLLLEAKGIRKVYDEEDLTQAIVQLMQLPSVREQLGKNAKKVVDENRGALAKHIAAISSYFKD